ncbi:MAG: phosphotransferase [Rhodovibrionaceae bacterium]
MSDRTAKPRSCPSFPPPPAITVEEASAVTRSAFGFDSVATPLDGEQDRNFQLVDGEGRHFILKLSNASDRGMIELQNAALDHVAAADPDCIVPRVVRAENGQAFIRVEHDDGSVCFARILTFVHGRAIGELSLGPVQFERIGESIARLDLALSRFKHGAERAAMIWDIRKAPDARPLLRYVKDSEDRDRATRILDAFEQRMEGLSAQRAQFVHHDLNPSNVIALSATQAPSYGFIDFGDIEHAPLISELAIAAAYNVAVEGHPLSAIRAILTGYASVTPLVEEEIELIFTLISVRLVQSLAISHWRAQVTPKNSAYLLRYGNKASSDLARLATLSDEDARTYLSDH